MLLIPSCIQSGSRLFGFIGAGATFGQLFGSLFATGMAWLGPCMRALCFWKILFATNLPTVTSLIQIRFARSLPICFSHDGICCSVIQKDQ